MLFPLRKDIVNPGCSLHFQLFSNFGVNIGCCAQAGVPEDFLHRFHFFAGLQKQCGEGMTQVMESYFLDARFFQQPLIAVQLDVLHLCQPVQGFLAGFKVFGDPLWLARGWVVVNTGFRFPFAILALVNGYFPVTALSRCPFLLPELLKQRQLPGALSRSGRTIRRRA